MSSKTSRCEYKFFPERWEREQNKPSHFEWTDDDFFVSMGDDDILTHENGELVWRCPHPTIDDDTACCLFHTPPDDRPSESKVTSQFISIINGKKDAVGGSGVRPPQFIGANLGQLSFTDDNLLKREEDILIDLRHAEVGGVDCKIDRFQHEMDMSGATIENQFIAKGTIFENSIQFDNTTFSGGVAFLDSTFENQIRAEGANFKRGFYFSETTFEVVAYFRNIDVEYDAEFEQVRVEGGTFFHDACFNCYADFSGTIFDSVDFSNGKFTEGVYMRDSSFNGSAQFNDTEFVSIEDNRCAADFSEADFEKSAEFSGSEFKGRVTFGGVANFEQATFNKEADFSDISVTGAAGHDGGTNFKSAKINGVADFSESKFEAGTNFIEAQFNDQAKFQEVEFKNYTAFSNATFQKEANFSDSTFEKVDFDDTIFTHNATFQFSTSQTEPMFQGETNLSGAIARRGINFEPVEDKPVLQPIFDGSLDCDDADLSDSNFTDRYLGDRVDLSGVDLSVAILQNADFSGANLKGADLGGADLRHANMTESFLEDATLTGAQLYGADFTDAALHGTLFGNAQINNETSFIDRGSSSLIFRRFQVVNKLGLSVGNPRTIYYDTRRHSNTDLVEQWVDETPIENGNSPSKAAAVYQSLESLARENGASEFASTCVAWRKDMERIQYIKNTSNRKQIGNWLVSWTSNLTTRYGESPWRVVLTSLSVVCLGAGLYPLLGLNQLSIVERLYFSVSTFTPLVSAEQVPRPESWPIMILLMGQALLGVTLTALLVAVLDRKITR